MTREYQIIDTAFRITSPDKAVFGYVDAFLGTYTGAEAPLKINNRISMQVCNDCISGFKEDQYEDIPVHLTKHPYWNFAARRYSSDPLTVKWIDKDVTIRYNKESGELVLSTPAFVKPSFTGEYLFHCMRSLALYLRDTGIGYFMHASGVQVNGNGILFMGSANTGKTTLFLEAVLSHLALPFCNDRVFLKREGSSLIGYSWPSYVSMCEGTILNYPLLEQAAKRYDEHSGYSTISWGAPLKPSFSKLDKRIYPHQWLTDITERKYVPASPVKLIVLPALSEKADLRIEELNPAGKPAEEWLSKVLEENSFDLAEPSFMPWHGLSPPAAENIAAQLIADLKEAKVRIVKMSVPFNKVPEAIHSLLNYINHE